MRVGRDESRVAKITRHSSVKITWLDPPRRGPPCWIITGKARSRRHGEAAGGLNLVALRDGIDLRSLSLHAGPLPAYRSTIPPPPNTHTNLNFSWCRTPPSHFVQFGKGCSVTGTSWARVGHDSQGSNSSHESTHSLRNRSCLILPAGAH